MILTRKWRMLGCAAVLSGGLFLGCGRKSAVPAAAGSGAASPSTIGQTATAVTEEDARSFAAKFIDGVSRNDMTAVSAVFDWDTLAERGLDGVPLSESAKKGAKTGLLQSWTQNNTLIQQIHQQMQQGDAYQLLRIHEVDGRRRALLRLLPPDGGVNYHDLVLAKSADGQCRAIDMHVFSTGEMLSDTVKRTMLQMTATQNRSLIDRLAGRDKLMVKHQDQILAMIKAVQGGNGAEGLRIYRELPPEVQQEKTLLIVRLQASQMVGDDDEYMKTLTDFRGSHPADGCIDFLSIDYFIFRKDYDAALQAVAAVSKSVGGDPYLEVLRGNILLAAEKYDDADGAFRAAIDGDPKLLPAWWGRVTVSLKKQDQETVLALLKEMDGRFEMQWNDLTENEEFAGFVQSPYHQQWLDYRSEAKKSAEE